MINKRLLSLCTDSKKYIVLSIITKFLDLLCNIGIVYIIGSVVNAMLSRQEINIGVIGVFVIGILVLRFLSNYYETLFSFKAAQNAKITLRKLAYKKLFSLGVRYENHMSTGTIVQSVGDGIESLDNYFGKYIPQIFYALLSPITLFILISQISFTTALVLIIGVPLIPVSIVAFMKIAKRAMKKYWNKYSNLSGSFLESLHGLTTLKLFRADDIQQEKMKEETETFRKMTMKVLSVQLNSITIMDIIAYGGTGIGSIIALLQLSAGNINIGQMIIIILLSANFFIPLRLLGSYFHIATNSIAAANKVFELLDIEENSFGKNKNLKKVKSISVNGLSFSYQDGENALENVSFKIRKNETIAFVGESGSGKSTIAKLLVKMYNAKNDCIQINGIDINDINSNEVTKHINLISSDSYIFNTTILENLLMAKEDATDEEVKNALKTAQLYDFVKSQKDKLYAKTGEGGALLSGGQKQRLALARSLLAEKEVLILDEATSNIDSESEELIFKAVNSLKGKKTLIIISHRLANVKDADRIYLLKDGKIIEKGTHKELEKSKGHYYKMLKKQQELENIRKGDSYNEEERYINIS